MPKRKLVPAVEKAFIVTILGVIGGVAVGVAGANLAPELSTLPNFVWILVAFFGIFLLVVAILGAIHYDDEVTRLVESVIYPPIPKRFWRSWRSDGRRWVEGR